MSGAVADRLTERDLIDAYSAVFAVRMPGLAPGPRAEQRAIHALFVELVFGEPLAAETRNVFLEPTGMERGAPLKAVPMPELAR